MRIRCACAVLVSALSVCAGASFGQLQIYPVSPPTPPDVPGSDGAFTFVPDVAGGNTMTINLSQAVTAPWLTPGNGHGVYDAAKWAVVFKYSGVNIPAGKTVVFSNHPTNAPVVWLVSGNVAIAGTVSLNGMGGGGTGSAPPGPGGFAGGFAPVIIVSAASAGFGPGGGGYGDFSTTSGSYNGGSYTYGNTRILPLIGGSGGAGGAGITTTLCGSAASSGGAGGGAILIAAQGTITLNTGSAISANGGAGACVVANCNIGCPGHFSGGGSGGAIRLVANAVTGVGTLQATGGGNGGPGRKRVEANSVTFTDLGLPAYTFDLPGAAATIWPDATAPSVAFHDIDTANHLTQGSPMPMSVEPRFDDPQGNTSLPSDVTINTANAVILSLETHNLPTNTPVTVRAVPAAGAETVVSATLVGGNSTLAAWTARASLPRVSGRVSTLIATAGTGSNIAVTRHYSAYGLGLCVADVDNGTGTGRPEGGVTIDDLLLYLQWYAAGSLFADVDDGAGTGTPDGGVTIDDLLYYLARYTAGC